MTIVNLCCKHPAVGDDVHGYRDQTARRPDVTDSDDSDRLNSETCKYLSSLGVRVTFIHSTTRGGQYIASFISCRSPSIANTLLPSLGLPFEPLVLDVACSNAYGVFTSGITWVHFLALQSLID